jgi:hypothetical protein
VLACRPGYLLFGHGSIFKSRSFPGTHLHYSHLFVLCHIRRRLLQECHVHLQVSTQLHQVLCSHSLISREYSHFVIATMQFIKCITLFAAPAIYTLCVHDVTRQEEWRLIFFMMSGALVVVSFVYFVQRSPKSLKIGTLKRVLWCIFVTLYVH